MSFNTLPIVSVLLPIRDGARFLAQALDSLIAQQSIAFEIIAIDDGSRDETPSILARYAAQHSCLRKLHSEGGSISRALNLGLTVARGRYIARMDADDIALPGRLAAQAHYLDAHPHIGVLGTQAMCINNHGLSVSRIRVPTGIQRVRTALAISAALIHPTVMMRREQVLAVNGYRPLLDGAEDYDLWLRLSAVTELDNLSKAWLLFRRHDAQVSNRYALRQAHRSALALMSHRFCQAGLADPLAGQSSLQGWRSALTASDPAAVFRVRALTAAALIDNGGSRRPRGSAYLQAVCRTAKQRADRAMIRRLALACVRHQLQLLRAGRGREALAQWPTHLASCHFQLLKAYFTHASILWRS